MKLSIIITAHDEGLLAHKTMLSVSRALEDFAADYEIIIHIDKGSLETEEYFARYEDDERFTILKNAFGDLGKSRNAAIKVARGELVSLLDADDLVSKNYFAEAVKTLEEADGEIVVHPNYCVTFEDFGSHYVFQTFGESMTPEMDAMLLLAKHRWISAISAKRETLLKHPYIATKDGYGHEDYALSIELTNSKVQHKIAKGTVYFYRRKEFSLLRQSNGQRCTQPYSEIFDTQKWKEYELPEEPAKQGAGTAQTMREMYVKIRNNKMANAVITPLAELAKKVTGKKLIANEKVPAEVLSEWKELAKIELQIFPAPYILDEMTIYDTETLTEVSKAYYKICQQVREKPDFVFVVPWVISGGSDKVLLNYLKALEELHPEWNIAVITMIRSDNEWRHKLPDNAYLVEFGNIAENLSAEDRDFLLTRLLVQLQCKRIHVINSAEMLRWMRNHVTLVGKEFEITASIFCHGIIPKTGGEGVWDFADPHALRVYPLLKKIFTDNTKVVEVLAQRDGFDKEKVCVHYQPTKMRNRPARHYEAEKPLNILWAGRISVQKNPKLLVRIAEKLNPGKVQIDAYGRIDPDELEGFKFPKESEALHYKGPFQNFYDINLKNYDFLLYTSVSDGMPNIILEAAAAGMVTVASNVGGVGDFVRNGETGFLVDDIENEDAYVEVIEKIWEDPSVLNPLVEGAEELLQKNYSWKRFVKVVKKDFEI